MGSLGSLVQATKPQIHKINCQSKMWRINNDIWIRNNTISNLKFYGIEDENLFSRQGESLEKQSINEKRLMRRRRRRKTTKTHGKRKI